jgi:membrane protein
VSRLLKTLRTAFRIFSDKGARFLGAAVAFYALLSAAPLFIVVLQITGAIFGRARAESALWSGLGHWLAPDGVAAARELTERLERTRATGGVLGVLLVVYGSTRLFRAVRRALNQLWGIDLESIERARPRHLRYGYRYGIAMLFALLVAVMVSAMIVVKTALAFVATYAGAEAAAMQRLLFGADMVLSIGLAFVLFFALFRFLPAAPVTTREAATSGLVSTVLFAIGSALVTGYVRRKHLADLYEGASAIVIALLWVYYSTQVFLFGACVGAAIHGRGTEPEGPVDSSG